MKIFPVRKQKLFIREGRAVVKRIKNLIILKSEIFKLVSGTEN